MEYRGEHCPRLGLSLAGNGRTCPFIPGSLIEPEQSVGKRRTETVVDLSPQTLGAYQSLTAHLRQMVGKIVKEILVAAKLGDPNPESNPRLRAAVESGGWVMSDWSRRSTCG